MSLRIIQPLKSNMGSLNLVCPMCCGESFNNPQSLKYHLLSMTDNLYCPACSLRSDSVMALIQHLDRCGQGLNPEKQISKDMKHPPLELDHSTELLMVCITLLFSNWLFIIRDVFIFIICLSLDSKYETTK